MVEIIEKRVFKIEKQILDNKTDKRKIYTKSLNNNKNTINLLVKLEFFLVPITGRHMYVETLYQGADV